MKTFLLPGLILSALASVTACDDSGSSEFDEVASSMDGIYRVQTYTLNDEACSPGGESQLASDRYALATTATVFGLRILTVTSCASIQDCRDKLALIEAGQGFGLDFGFTVSAVGADGALLGEGAGTGFDNGAVCSGGELTATTMSLTGTALRIEKAITIADDYAPDAEGFCTTELAAKAAAGKTCSQLEVLTAELVEAL